MTPTHLVINGFRERESRKELEESLEPILNSAPQNTVISLEKPPLSDGLFNYYLTIDYICEYNVKKNMNFKIFPNDIVDAARIHARTIEYQKKYNQRKNQAYTFKKQIPTLK
jgi:hypothetical protein